MSRAENVRRLAAHETYTTERLPPRKGCRAFCTCGWKTTGFPTRDEANVARAEHTISILEMDRMPEERIALGFASNLADWIHEHGAKYDADDARRSRPTRTG